MKLTINDKDFTHFVSFDITLTHNAVASSFTFTGLNRMIPDYLTYPKCEIFDENDQLLLSGIIISQQQKLSSTSELFSVSGYSKAGILEDCNLPKELYPLQNNNLSLKEISDKILSFYDIEFSYTENVAIDFTKNYNQTTIKIDETIKQYLDRLATQRNIILTNTRHGDLLFTRFNSDDLYTELEIEEGRTGFISAELTVNGQEMYAETTILKQAGENPDSGQYTIKNPYAADTQRTKTKILRNGNIFDVKNAALSELHNQLRHIKIRIEVTEYAATGSIVEFKAASLGIKDWVYLFVEQVKIVGTAKNIKYELICVPLDVYTENENVENIFDK